MTANLIRFCTENKTFTNSFESKGVAVNCQGIKSVKISNENNLPLNENNLSKKKLEDELTTAAFRATLR